MSDKEKLISVLGPGGDARTFMLKSSQDAPWVAPFLDRVIDAIKDGMRPEPPSASRYVVLDDDVTQMLKHMTDDKGVYGFTAFKTSDTKRWQCSVLFGTVTNASISYDESPQDGLATAYYGKEKGG